MNPPEFWQHGHRPPFWAQALSGLTGLITSRRLAQPGWTAPVPVICCGNAGAGGAGKTPLALDLAARLLARGRHPAFLTRGHGGKLRGPVRVGPLHTADDVGDEALLLTERAPTYVGADRAASAKVAVGEGADVLILDDGLQNPGLVKTMSLLVVDGGAGFGNGWLLPAGPLREPVLSAARRCRAAVLIGADSAHAAAQLPAGYAVLTAEIVPDAADLAALPAAILAFAGIGRPAKFFDTLRAADHAPKEMQIFPDHHRYTPAELARLHAKAAAEGLALVTTRKDFVRLEPNQRQGIWTFGISLRWSNEAALESLLSEALAS